MTLTKDVFPDACNPTTAISAALANRMLLNHATTDDHNHILEYSTRTMPTAGVSGVSGV